MLTSRYLLQRSTGANVFAAILLLTSTNSARANPPSDGIVVGISQSLTRDLPKPLATAGMPGAGALMEKSAGVPCKILPASPCDELGEKLANNAVQLGVFSGVEFAWERARHPGLRPLAILINQHPERRAVLMARKDNAVADFAGLKQSALAIPQRSGTPPDAR